MSDQPLRFATNPNWDRKAEPITIDVTDPVFRQLLQEVYRKHFASLTPHARKRYNGRLERGLELVKENHVKPVPAAEHKRRFEVVSSDRQQIYQVDLDEKNCTCIDHLKGFTCKHRVAAYYYEQTVERYKQRNPARPVTASPSKSPAPSQPAAGKDPKQERIDQILRELGFDPDEVSTGSLEGQKAVERTLARLRQIHDQLNMQLYALPEQRPAIHTPADAAQILQCFIGNLDHEEMWVLLLDSRNRIKNLVMLYKGSVNSSQVRVAEVFKQAILENAPAILLAHNHPSGNTQPSPEDVTVTRAIYQAGKLLDIDLLDHLVVARDTFVSLKEKGLGFA